MIEGEQPKQETESTKVTYIYIYIYMIEGEEPKQETESATVTSIIGDLSRFCLLFWFFSLNHR
jgi:hypothetical protein